MASKRSFSITSSAGTLFEAGSLEALQQILRREKEFWQKLVLNKSGQNKLRLHRSGETFLANYDALESAVAAHDFGADGYSVSGAPAFAVLPPRGSVHGSVLIDLLENGDTYEAACVARHWWVQHGWAQSQVDRDGGAGDAERLGVVLVLSRRQMLKALQLRPVAQKVEAEAEKLGALVEELQARGSQFAEDVTKFDVRMDRADSRISARVAAFKRVSTQLINAEQTEFADMREAWEARWAETHNTFTHHLQYRAPALLWNTKGQEHRKASRRAFFAFLAVLVLTVVAAALVVFCFGDFVAESFSTIRCDPDTGICETAFSFKGPVTVGGLLLVASMLIWAMRFFSKIYLSERHLALGCEERKAFTEAYLALVMDNSVSREQEAIVLATLFRPSQDGVIRDEDPSMDISAAAILAKAMAGPRS